MSKQAPASELSSLPELVPTHEAARLFGLKPESLGELRRRGKLAEPRTVLDGKRYYAREDVIHTYEARERSKPGREANVRPSRAVSPSPGKSGSPANPAPTAPLISASDVLHSAGVPSPKAVGDPAEVAASYARHFATLLSFEEPESPQWRFLLGQLSASATLANVLRR